MLKLETTDFLAIKGACSIHAEHQWNDNFSDIAIVLSFELACNVIHEKA